MLQDIRTYGKEKIVQLLRHMQLCFYFGESFYVLLADIGLIFFNVACKESFPQREKADRHSCEAKR